METKVVRESKFRHVYAKPWRKEVCITNLKVHSSASTQPIRCSSKYFAVPWQVAGGALAVVPVSQTGKVPDRYPLITAHSETILDFQFSPFHDDIIATGSRDSIIKLWKVPEEGMKENLSVPAGECRGHKGRITTMAFNPVADNILLTSAGDKSLKIWDLNKFDEGVNIEGPADPLNTTVWNDNGTLIAAGCPKDKVLRVYDARSGSLAQEGPGHEGGKGFQICFLESDRILTVGANKASKREVSIYDLKSGDLSKPVATRTVDINSSLLFPYYDPGTGVVFLLGRGDSVLMYEVDNEDPFVHPLQRSTCASYNGSCMLPKRCVDVTQGEIARFLNASKDSIEIVSVYVPRKTAKTVFQEDIYPPVPSTEPALSSEEWLAGKESAPKLVSLAPPGMASIFSIPADQGGKNLRVENERRARRSASPYLLRKKKVAGVGGEQIKKGALQYYTGGWWTPWADRFVSVGADALEVFENEGAASVALSISFANIKSAEVLEEDNAQFVVTLNDDTSHKFKATEASIVEKWIYTLGCSRSESAVAAVSVQTGERKLEGFLELYTPGSWFSFSNWTRRYFVLEDMMLKGYASENIDSEHPIENFHLARVASVIRSENIAANKDYTLKLCTPTRVIHLASDTEEDRDKWVEALLCATAGSEDAVDFESQAASGALEGYLQRKKTGLFSLARGWDNRWVSCAGKDLLYYRDHTATAPLDRLSLQLVRDVLSNDEPTDFSIIMNDRTTHVHRAEDEEDRDNWVIRLNFLRKQFIDMMELLGITDEDLKGKQDLEANMLDPSDVKKGKQPLLVQVKGRRRITVGLVELKKSSLHEASVFVLDHGKVIYQWNGCKAPRVAKGKALDLASKIKQKERGGICKYVVLDQGKNDDDAAFWKVLGNDGDIEVGGTEEGARMVTRVYRILTKDVEQAQRIRLVHEGPPPPIEVLDSKAAHVLDANTEIYVWVGKGCTSYQRKMAILVAHKLTQEPDRKPWTYITKLYEEGETILFKERFGNWPGMLPISLQKQDIKSNVASAQAQEPLDVAAMHKYDPPTHQMYDDGSGKITSLCRIEEFQNVEVPRDEWGQFYSGESYIIVYTYTMNNKEANLIYFWQGRDSSRSEKGTSAFKTVETSEGLAAATQIRVEQSKEERHFHAVFGDKFVIHKGKRADHKTDAVGLYLVRGQDPDFITPTEIAPAAAALHSKYAFVVRTPVGFPMFVWNGKFSNENEKSRALAFAKTITGDDPVTVVEEGAEPEDFWDALGGKDSYYGSDGIVKERRDIRCFLCSNASGTVKVDEIFQPTQEDIKHLRHTIILDAFEQIYIWFGEGSMILERKMAMEAVQNYVKQSPHGHARQTPIWVIYAYKEPREFTTQFPGWTKQLYPAAHRNHTPEKEPLDDLLSKYKMKTYSYQELLQEPLPPGVDPTKLENYLDEAEFQNCFGMKKAEFMQLPAWKAEKLKQEVGLF